MAQYLDRGGARIFMDVKRVRDRIPNLLQNADIGIEHISDDGMRKLPMSDLRVQDILSELKQDKGELGDDIRVWHKMLDTGALVDFDIQDESRGTQRFLLLLGLLLSAANTGLALVLDEFDSSLHPLLVRKLIQMFQSPEGKTSGAQLIFTTHDSTLMDSDLFRRDQIWLAEKNQGGATELFSLHDFPTSERPRNTTALQRNYLAGRYGGVPHFGPAFEDL
jgi:hypothetical protein